MNAEDMTDIDAAKDEVFAAFAAMDAAVTGFEMVEEKWAECEETIAMKTYVTAPLMMRRRMWEGSTR